MTAPTVVETATRTLIPVRADGMALGLTVIDRAGNARRITSVALIGDFAQYGYDWTPDRDLYACDAIVQMVVIPSPRPAWAVSSEMDADGVTRHGSSDGPVWLYRYDDPDGTVGPVLVGLAAGPDGDVIELAPESASSLGAALLVVADLAGGE